MTWPITRLQEAVVEKFSSDSVLVELTCDGQTDDVGAIHHIGMVLNEAGMKDRLPFVGFQVVTSDPLILNEGRAKIERSIVMAYVYSRSCLLYTSPSPRDLSTSRMPSSA